ncbi:NADP-dependent oxidoreductase [Psychrobacter sp.]|uniref:NADP-dependent oxidoreductase n=1 Tax=Psychrobacter sp. TaxID=56811 RepID=UPI0025FE328E|nr:NADP-dependent oxidoreductase [Psychrobacter sp.]
MSYDIQLPESQSAVTLTEFGAPEVLHYQTDVDVPKMGDKQVLVKIAYASVNPVDYKTRQGLGWGADNIKNNQYANGKPAILGFDMAGEVVASNSQTFKVGDKVAALNFKGGCYAQYNVVDAELLAKVPDSVDLKTAGALPCVGLTAYQSIKFAFGMADIKSDDHVVMNAPAGGVGHLMVQMLMQKVEQQGIKLTVICSPEKYKKLESLIDTTKLAGWIDYTKEDDFPSLQADLLMDLVGNEAGVRALSVLKEQGQVVVLPSIWVDKLQQAGLNKNIKVKGFKANPNGEDLSDVLAMIESCEIKLHFQNTYPLAQAEQAHHEIEKGDSFGKIVLEL